MKRLAASPAGELVFSLVLIACVGAFVAWSYAYAPRVRLVPLLVGWSTLVVAVVDFVVRYGPALGLRGRLVAWRWQREAGEGQRPVYPSLGKEVRAVGWLAGFVAGVYFFGFLAMAFVYVLASLYLRGRTGVRLAGAMAALCTLGIWLVFTQLLQYELYAGMLPRLL